MWSQFAAEGIIVCLKKSDSLFPEGRDSDTHHGLHGRQGSKLAGQTIFPGEMKMFCPKCGKENIDQANFCVSCGTDLRAVLPSPKKKCPFCSGEIDFSATECEHCGAEIGDGQASAEKAQDTEVEPYFKGIRVLVADDQIFIRALTKRLLMSMGCKVVGEACNGQEAVNFFFQEKPDLLLLDLKMPQKNGDQVLEEIISVCPDAYVVMFTSISDSDIVHKCIRLGAVNYIRKDVPAEKLKKSLSETLLAIQKRKFSQ